MLSRGKFKDAGFLATEIALITIWGATLILFYNASQSIYGPPVTWDLVRIAALFSAGFMVLSGYAFTIPILHACYNHRQSWLVRSVSTAALFVLHFLIFLFLFGDYFGALEAFLLLVGALGVALASAVASYLWRARRA